eukprot:CAMPEP_0184525334 /NCGR_PEP_ID=MMETSP0198_2-20121128/10037_1 /TAXON_ID=1112570 /ORGANISM="Thraustochytrium sp., Strain LLF1b" /LENGTH=337 /DNA_ID=CAMNT_0026916775 /DNA_START=135 /DNA_END=1148 /DNA_ORIENTATION=-
MVKGKAVLARKFGMPDSLTVEDIEFKDPSPRQCQVEVMCAGVNFPDCLMIQGKYQARPPFPFSPGGEISGIVRKVGSAVKGFKAGDRVLAMLGHGGFAEWVNADESTLVNIGDKIDFETASGFMMTYGTTLHAFRQRGNLRAGDSVLILGAAGGVGLAAVDLARAMGASQIIAAASSEEKLEICRQYGATHTINYSTEDLKKRVMEITQKKGVDIVYDPVGDKFAEPAIRSLAWKGRYLVIGFAGGEIPKIPLNLLLLKGSSAAGVFWGSFTQQEPAEHAKNTKILVDMISTGLIKPLVSSQYKLEDAPRALEDMMARKVKGKAVILCSSSTQGSKL